MVTTGMAIIAGEISTNARVSYSDVVREVINEVGLHRRPNGNLRRYLCSHGFARHSKS